MTAPPTPAPQPLDLSAVERRIAADEICTGMGLRMAAWAMSRYVALARAVLAERVAQAACEANTDIHIFTIAELYQARDDAHAAVDAALAALAVGE